MAKMTPEEIAKSGQKFVKRRCDKCQKPLTGLLVYRGQGGAEYCTNACYEAAESTRGRIQERKDKDMIEKNTGSTESTESSNKKKKGSKGPSESKPVAPKENKAAEPVDDLEVEVEDDEDEEVEVAEEETTVKKDKDKKKKKSTPAPAPTPEPTKKDKKAAKAPEPPPTKGKKSKAPAHGGPYRPDSKFQKVWDKLSGGKKFKDLETLFEGVGAGDPNRMLGMIIWRGNNTKEWAIVRNDDSSIQMTKNNFKPAK